MAEDKKLFKIVALGCRCNQYEAEAFREQLESIGFREAKENEEATLCLINTCTVTEAADSDSRHEIRKLIRHHQKAKVVVTGCMAERGLDQLNAIEGIHCIVPNAKKESLIAMLFPEETPASFSIRSFSGHTRAFLKVQDGCNSFCSYCIIPFVRGRSRSRKIDEIVSEAEALVKSGYPEIVVTGINVGDFKGDRGEDLVDLLRALDNVEGLNRIRISSIDPSDISERFLELLSEKNHLCHSLHLVLQSGSNAILKRMNRKYSRELYLQKVHQLQAIDPDFSFTTDIIVGFPGEEESHFEETLSMVKEVQFAKVHFFPFSARAKTRASQFKERVPASVISERKERLSKIAYESAFQFRERFLGRVLTILTERGERGGHSDHFIRVSFPPADLKKYAPNQFIDVKITANHKEFLEGTPL